MAPARTDSTDFSGSTAPTGPVNAFRGGSAGIEVVDLVVVAFGVWLAESDCLQPLKVGKRMAARAETGRTIVNKADDRFPSLTDHSRSAVDA